MTTDAALFTPTSQVMLLVAGAVALMAVLIWRRSPRSYLVIVVIMLAVSRLSIDVGGFTLRADQLAVLTLAVPVLGVAVVGRDAERGAHRTLGRLLIAYVIVGAMSRALEGAPTAEFVRATLLIGVAVFAFWLPHLLIRRGLTAADMTMCAVGAGAVAGAAAALLAAASYLSSVSTGVQTDPSDPGLHLAYVSFYEANLLGVFLAVTLILSLLHPSVSTWRRPAARTLVPLAIAAGLLATLTRGSWIGFAIGMIAGALALRTHSRHRRRLWLKMAVVASALVVMVAASPFRPTITARVADAVDLSTGSGFGRVRISNLAMTEWRTSPLVGHGFLSFNEQLPGSPAGGRAWIPSFSVAVLHDTGVLGAVIVALFFGLLFRRLWTRADRTAASWMGVSVCLLVAGQATQSQVLPFFWFFLGLATVATESATVAGRRQSRGSQLRGIGGSYVGAQHGS